MNFVKNLIILTILVPKKELHLSQLVGDDDEFFSAEECLKTMVDEKDQ